MIHIKSDFDVGVRVFNNMINTKIADNLSAQESLNKTLKNFQESIFDKIEPSNNGRNINLHKITDIEEIKKKYGNRNVGIYYIIVKLKDDKIKGFKDEWDRYSSKKSIPKIKKENLEQKMAISKESDKWKDAYLLYVGKSESNVFRRITEHINLKESTTYSMRLKGFENVYKNLDCEFYWGCLIANKDREDVVLQLLNHVEKYLHENFCPWIGTSRS